jgi:hypothetical protein
MVRGAWNSALLDEMRTNGQVFKDQLDALERAFSEVGLNSDPWIEEMRRRKAESIALSAAN